MVDRSVVRAIDANAILRYLLEDNARQYPAAQRLIESEVALGVSLVALSEVAWTLTGPYYRVERKPVAGLLTETLSRENIVALGFIKEEALATLQKCASDNAPADFGDALIAACARSAGIDEIYSLDRRFVRAGITPISPE